MQPNPDQVRAHAVCARLLCRRMTPSGRVAACSPCAVDAAEHPSRGLQGERSGTQPLPRAVGHGNTLIGGQSQAPSQRNTARALPQLLPAQSGLPAFHIFDDSGDQPPPHLDSSAAEKVEVRAPCSMIPECEPQHSTLTAATQPRLSSFIFAMGADPVPIGAATEYRCVERNVRTHGMAPNGILCSQCFACRKRFQFRGGTRCSLATASTTLWCRQFFGKSSASAIGSFQFRRIPP